MLKVQRKANGDVVFTVSGQLDAGNVGELSALVVAEPVGRPLVLDLEDLVLVDREAVSFLRVCEGNGVVLRSCPPYIRAWMAREGEQT
jgi:hypothetical protein